MDTGFPPVAFTVMGKGRRELSSWRAAGSAPCCARSPVSVNSGRSPEITSMEMGGEVTFELEANTGFCFLIYQIVLEFLLWVGAGHAS